MLNKKAAKVKANIESLMKFVLQKQQNLAIVNNAFEERVAAMQAQQPRAGAGNGVATGR